MLLPVEYIANRVALTQPFRRAWYAPLACVCPV